MRHYEVRAFAPYHYAMLGGEEATVKRFESNNNVGRSGYCNDELLVCAGIMMPWSGYGISWAMLSPNAKRHYHFVHRAVLEGLNYFIAAHRLRRVEANVDARSDDAKHWATHLGFVFESWMPSYGPNGETFIKYVRIK
jgi:hypothetical protein